MKNLEELLKQPAKQTMPYEEVATKVETLLVDAISKIKNKKDINIQLAVGINKKTGNTAYILLDSEGEIQLVVNAIPNENVSVEGPDIEDTTLNENDSKTVLEAIEYLRSCGRPQDPGSIEEMISSIIKEATSEKAPSNPLQEIAELLSKGKISMIEKLMDESREARIKRAIETAPEGVSPEDAKQVVEMIEKVFLKGLN